MCHCGILSMLAEQVANICGDGFVSLAEDADGMLTPVMLGQTSAAMVYATTAEDTLHAEPKPAGPKALAGNGNTVQCMGDGGAGACPRFTSPRSNLTLQLKFNYKNYMNLIEVYCIGF